MTEDTQKQILSQLGSINVKIEKVNCTMDAMKDDNARYQKWLQDIEKELGGNSESSGIRTRVRELETAQKCQIWYWRALVTGILGSAFGWIVHLFGNHK